MRIQWMLAATLVVLPCRSVARGQMALDTVQLRDEAPLTGRITEIQAWQVVLEQRGRTETIELPRIDRIQWAKEPAELKTARELTQRREWSSAREMLNKVSATDTRLSEPVRTEIAFLDGFIDAQLALAGTGSLESARQKLFDFAKNNRNSIRFAAAVETLAEVDGARQDYRSAERFLQQLEKAPWPEYQAKVLEKKARLAFAHHQVEDALKSWQAVAERSGIRPEQRAVAMAGIALCQSPTGPATSGQNGPLAIATMERLIREADQDDRETLATLYLLLGYAHAGQKQTMEAVLAFLHVDLIFHDQPADHAEALGSLVPLWQQLGREDRARDAQARLRQDYGGTYWSQMLQPAR